MEILSKIFGFIVNDLGSTIVLPLIMVIVGKAFGMKWKDAFSSGLLLAVAFKAVGLVTGFMSDAISPVGKSMAETIGKSFPIVDGGWAPLSSITWTWKYAFLMFPIQIGINLLMLVFKKTNTLNIDMWNVWGKAFVGYLTVAITGKLYFGIIVACIMIVMELILGDAMQPRVQRVTGIENVSCPHRHMLLCSLIYPVDKLLRKVPFLNKDYNLNSLRKKFGVLFDRHILGFILGTAFGLIARYGVIESIKLGIVAGAALYLLPIVVRIFMNALNPVAEAATTRMKKVMKTDRDIYIGLDNPMLLGEDAIWIVVMMCMPVTLLLAFLLPGNGILPFAALDNLTLGLCVFMVTGGNILRMFILYIGFTPVYLLAATSLAPLISQLGVQNGIIAQGTLIASAGMDAPAFTYIFSNLFTFIQGNFIPLLLAVVYIAGFIFTVRGFKKEGIADKEAIDMITK